jgi:hypothetical protein
MNRRSFFTDWLKRPSYSDGITVSPVRPLSSGLEPYIPGTTAPWDAVRAGHLLRRTTFLPRWSDVSALLGLTPSAAVDLLLNTAATPAAPGMADSVTESLDGLDITYQNIIRGQWGSDMASFRNWYVDVIRTQGVSLQEKMVSFWSGHFTTGFAVDDTTFVVGPLMYRQNQMLRDQAFANFKDLVMSVTLDAGMLVYLGGDLNNSGAPNENYGRELLELYTMGLGHYTESDIKNAARVLTGWRAARFQDKPAPNGMFKTYFDAKSHDINAKEFLGVSIPARDITTNTEFLVQRDEVRRMIDIIFEKRAREVATYISRKIYRYFVYSNPTATDEAVISAMADLFIQSNFEIKPLMAALLKSAHFFDNANIGAQIKTPAEFEIGLSRQLSFTGSYFEDMLRLGMELFQPPDVSGWPGYHDWITTTTYPIRADLAARAVTGMDDTAMVAFIKSFPDYTNVSALIDNLTAILLPRHMSAERKATLQTKLLGGAPDYEWPDVINNSASTAARNMRDMLTTLVQLPDFQLC